MPASNNILQEGKKLMPLHLARRRRIGSHVPSPDGNAESDAAAQGNEGYDEQANIKGMIYQCGIISDKIQY
jgi:hypothetical protein